jgi:hypothetical protein
VYVLTKAEAELGQVVIVSCLMDVLCDKCDAQCEVTLDGTVERAAQQVSELVVCVVEIVCDIALM